MAHSKSMHSLSAERERGLQGKYERCLNVQAEPLSYMLVEFHQVARKDIQAYGVGVSIHKQTITSVNLSQALPLVDSQMFSLMHGNRKVHSNKLLRQIDFHHRNLRCYMLYKQH